MERQEFTADCILHGGDYNPEQWLDRKDILEKDIEYLKKARCNTVTLGVFSWASLEREEGCYDFGWLEAIMERLYQNGIRVILATPTGAKPRWMAAKYPEVLRTSNARVRQLYGGRHNHCYTSPVYREKAAQINRRLAEKFGQHPAVIMWHISNEYNGECHCELCQQAFRDWLKQRYQTIEELNRRWCTSFWGHNYNDFDQVESPSPIGDMIFNGLNLDWKRFVTYQTLDFAKAEIRAIRAGGSNLPTTTNLMYFFAQMDYQKFGDVFDVISWDNYPSWHGEAEIETAWDSGLYHDIVRSINGKPFLIMESCPSSTNWKPICKLKKPGFQTLCSMQAAAHGSDSVLYFQIRQSEGSYEKFHGAVIDHYGGDDTRVFREVARTGAVLAQLNGVAGTVVRSEAAIFYDWESNWAMETSTGPRNQGLHHKEAVLKHYQALRRIGLNVDVLSADQELDGYKLAVVPMLYMFKGGFAEKLRAFVEQGGTVVMTYWSGIADENDRCYLGGTPHELMDVFGVRQTEIDALYDGESNAIVGGAGDGMFAGRTYECKYLCELLEQRSAQVLMTYRDDFYAGQPAVTRNEYGSGTAYYIAADVEERFYTDLYQIVVPEAGLRPIVEGLPDGVEVSSREDDRWEYIFLQNFTGSEVAMESLVVPGDRPIRLLYGETERNIPAFDTLVLARKKEQNEAI